GDRHIHEIAVKNDSETPYPLYEVTSSGLTHSYSSFPGEPNKYRLGKVFSGKGFGMMTIDWDDLGSMIRLQIRDERNEIKREVTIPLDNLSRH
ncbi:MAG: alkaline phosphatase family protein, partial [Verrucomicrobiota bacterium]|nr:alkaline phosphatase family protein [Verrucomicrobiota bacterium]